MYPTNDICFVGWRKVLRFIRPSRVGSGRASSKRIVVESVPMFKPHSGLGFPLGVWGKPGTFFQARSSPFRRSTTLHKCLFTVVRGCGNGFKPLHPSLGSQRHMDSYVIRKRTNIDRKTFQKLSSFIELRHKKPVSSRNRPRLRRLSFVHYEVH